jgi:predicted kinase
MTNTVYITIGVSASGKTTWAEEKIKQLESDNVSCVNINRDDIRALVFSEKTGSPPEDFNWNSWQKKWESGAKAKWIKTMDEVIRWEIPVVIISDTNLIVSTREMIENKFTSSGYKVEHVLFPIDYETAVKRDLGRKNPVGSHVIASQMKLYWEQFEYHYTPDTSLPKTVLVDIDGTIAHANSRNIYDSTRVHTDDPDHFVMDVVRGLKALGYAVVCVSGRSDNCYDVTYEWLETHLGFPPNELFMRKDGDLRKDCVVKKEIFREKIEAKYYVVGVIDDRPQVIRMWISIGVKTLACGFQNTEF